MENAPIYLSAINMLITTFVAVYLVRLKAGLRGKERIEEITAEEISALNRKIHDRLTEVEFSIKAEKNPSEKTTERLLMTASRAVKYDETILKDVHRVLNNWSGSLLLYEYQSLTDEELSETKSKTIEFIKKIKKKSDSFLAKYKS